MATLYEIGEQYAETSAVYKARIAELREAYRKEYSIRGRHDLAVRISALAAIQADLSEMSSLCRHYYDKKGSRREL